MLHLFQLLNELRHHFVQVADDAVVGNAENRRVFILVDGADHPGVADAGDVLDLAGHAHAHVEVRLDLGAGKADAGLFRKPVHLFRERPRASDLAAQDGCQLAGFANVVEDVASGKGIVKRRTDPDAFVKGETIAATPGQVVWQNDLCQLIQYSPTTPDVAAEPLLYVPPLVNRFYMIDLQPQSSLVKWLVDAGRTVFVISWVNPGEAHRDKDVAAYILSGIVETIGVVRERTGRAPDLFAFCLGGTLVAIALA